MSWVKHTMGAAIIAASSFTPIAYGDDTEIYLGNNLGATTVRPNIVFIIDTSGSMDTKVWSQSKYDPTITYSGTCASDKIYYSTGKAPSCSTSYWFNSSSNYCKASQSSLAKTGMFQGRMAMWNRHTKTNRRDWDRFDDDWKDHEVECEADWAVHGKADGDGKTYPAEGSSGPWSTGTNKIRWNRTGTAYTLYTGNYLNWKQTSANASQTRLEIVQEVFSNIMDSTQDINVAVVRFAYSEGGYFATPMLPLNDSTRQTLKDVVNGFAPSGMTPLSETLYEVARFYRGETPEYGGSTSHPDCLQDGSYVSPIDYQCQKNFVVLLTDGEPTYDDGADTEIESLPNFRTITGLARCSGNCLDELAQYLYKKDQRTDLNDTQNVITYTVGFATDQELLRNAATKGGGKYYTTEDAAGLTDAFTTILTEILAVNTTFTAPAVSVNAFNRLNHRDELYFALFRPSNRPSWDGNIKRYRLGIPTGGDSLEVLDQSGTPAVDPNTGFFKTTAKSFWIPGDDDPDGEVVREGGAASRVTLPRTVYTDTGTESPSLVSFDADFVTAEMLGVDTDDIRDEVLAWASGIDILDEDVDGELDDPLTRMGDPLHTDPVLVTYGGTDDNPDITLFATTNAGFLHAIDTATGEEQFSYVPSDLLPMLNELYENAPSDMHPYGLDGPLGVWFKDINGNGTVQTADGDRIFIYASMRRGGRNIYALDVTNRASPSLQWVIKGGEGDFAELGETWSRPVLTRVKLNGETRTVLVIGGGYDPDQDANETVAVDDTGRAIYVVDAETGQRLWWAGPGDSDANLKLNDMQYSIPSTVRVIDLNGDGYADRFYVGDMGALLWRFDVSIENTGAGNFATGGVIAALGGDDAAGNRRFYYPPDVSMTPSRMFLNIAIGSGYRAHPLDTDIHDSFFVVRDKNVFSPPIDADGDVSYSKVDVSDLYNATNNLLGEGTVAHEATDEEREEAKAALDVASGLYVELNRLDGGWEGEKVLAESITIAGQVIFTTFTPVAADSAACAPSQGTAKTYIMNVLDATPAGEHDGIEGLTREDRHVFMVRGGIPPRPTPICTTEGCTVLIGTETPELNDNPTRNPIKTRWWRGTLQ